MPVTRIGPSCQRPGCSRPTCEAGLCCPCLSLARGFGRDPGWFANEPLHGPYSEDLTFDWDELQRAADQDGIGIADAVIAEPTLDWDALQRAADKSGISLADAFTRSR